jgi:hypothetical protein
VDTLRHPKVAVLLATYNGSQFIEAQIASLKENVTAFTLHWLDDHSTDNSQSVVRDAASKLGIVLHEWHRPQHYGFPGTFFRLLECVEADIYLFCDQDDIWQPGKIDATVENLRPDIASPVLCYSDALVFNDDDPKAFRRLSEVLSANRSTALPESKAFLFTPALGNTIGLTRPLREIFLTHREVACAYAFGHDWWLYLIAVALGAIRRLDRAPTTLWRQHASNFSAAAFKRTPKNVGRLLSNWATQQRARRVLARQAKGFVLASRTLTQGPRLEKLLTVARLVATLDSRQSLIDIARLMRNRAMQPRAIVALSFATVCLCSNAQALPRTR